MARTDTSGAAAATAPAAETSNAPARSGLVLIALILVAAVANLNLAVANVALPDIGIAFDSSQTTLDLVAVGYSLGLAASVLYLGALGDRYGRKMMLVLGISLSIPASIAAAYAPSDGFLIFALAWWLVLNRIGLAILAQGRQTILTTGSTSASEIIQRGLTGAAPTGRCDASRGSPNLGNL